MLYLQALIFFLCIRGTTLTSPSKPTEFSKGVIFLHQGNFLMTSSHWTLVNDLNFEHVDRQVQFISQSLTYLEAIIDRQELYLPNNGTPQLPTKGFEMIRNSFLNFQHEYRELQALITLPTLEIRKRSLIDLGGQALKFLFGTATSEDIESLNNEISQIKQRNEGIIHLLQSQTTLLNDTLNISKANRHQIYVLLKRQESFGEIMTSYSYKLAFEIILRTVEFSVQEFHFQMLELREAIDVLEQRRLSTYFVSRSVMLRTLKEIQTQLPKGYAMIEPIQPDTLFRYYQWITTTAVALPSKLRIFAQIPLITPSGYFDMYEIVKFPTYIPALNTFIQFQTKFPVIALSMDRQSYMLLQRQELTLCKTAHFSICSLDVPIQRAPIQSCEYSLFSGNENQVKDLCTRQIVPKYNPIFKRINQQGTWIYSIPNSLTLTIRCPTRHLKSPFKSTTRKLNNTGMINLPNACTGYLPGIILTSHFQQQTTLQLEIAQQLVIPAIEQIVNQTEIRLLQQRLATPLRKEILQKTPDVDIQLAERAWSNVQYDLEHLLQITSEVSPSHQPPSLLTILFSCLVTTFVMICLGCGIMYYLRRRKMPSISTPASTGNNRQNDDQVEFPLNDREVESQPEAVAPLPRQEAKPRSQLGSQKPKNVVLTY